MNRDLQLKLQAYVDGELSGRKAREVEQLLTNDAEAKALANELTMTKQVLAGNEPALSLPESREFYWSKIAREIERPEVVQRSRLWDTLFGWRKYLAPIAGMALVVFLAIGTLNQNVSDDFGHVAEVQNLSEHTGSFSFRSSDNMFVVWVYEKPQSPDTEPELIEEDDVTVQ